MTSKQLKKILKIDTDKSILLATSVIALTSILSFINEKQDFQKPLSEISFAEIPTIIIIFIMVLIIIISIINVFITKDPKK